MPALPILLLSVFLCWTSAHTAHAVTITNAKKAIQTAYDKENAAASRRDLAGTMAHFAPNFVGSLINGPVQNRDETRAEAVKLFSMQESLQGETVIRRISLRHNISTVIVVEHAKAVLLDPQTFEPNTLIQSDMSQDTWVLTRRGWKETQSRELAIKSTMNGVEIPGR